MFKRGDIVKVINPKSAFNGLTGIIIMAYHGKPKWATAYVTPETRWGVEFKDKVGNNFGQFGEWEVEKVEG